MSILVTGGTGYIGSHTVVELLEQGYEVIIADNLSNSYGWVVDRIGQIAGKRPRFENIDLADTEKTAQFFSRNTGITAIIHFAAFKAVGESVEFPLKYYRNNLLSLMNLLQGMIDHKIPDIVFSSSCTVYGQPEELPARETSPIVKAMSPYGNTKQISEEIITDASRHEAIRAVLLRYFNPVGAHESALIGEFPIGTPSNLMPYITQTAIGKYPYLRVWGNDYNTPDGTPIRDYIHVVDLAKAHVLAVGRLATGRNKQKVEVFNLGTGNGFSVMEVVRSFERTSGLKLNCQILGRRPGDIEQVWADTTLANSELGWKAEKSLDDMTRSAWNWEQALAKKNS